MIQNKIILPIVFAVVISITIPTASAITTTDTFYACTAPFGNPEIHLINKTTGVSISNQTITVAGLTVLGCNGLAVDPTTGTFYAIIKEQVSPSNRHLITLDPVTGIGTDLGATGDSMASLNFLANGSVRTITGFNSGTPEKYTALDKTNAQATGLCTLSTGGGQGQGLALNFDDGKIYHVNTFNDGLTTVDNETIDPCGKTNSVMSGFNYGEIQSFTYNTNDALFYGFSFNSWFKMTSSGVVTFLSQHPNVPESPFYVHQDSTPSDVNLTVGDFNGEILDGTLTIPTATPEVSKLTTKLKSTGGATGTIVGQIIDNSTATVKQTSNNSIDASTLTGSYQDFTFTFLVYGTIQPNETIVGIRFLSGTGTIQSAIVSPPIASVEGSNLRIDPILNIQVNEDLEGIIFQKPVSTSPTQVQFKGIAFDLLLAVDTTPPVISTTVPEPIPIQQNSVFDEFEFVSCIDDTDGDITNSMTTVGTVDTSKPKSYFVDYTCTDVATNSASLNVQYLVKRSPTGSGGQVSTAPTTTTTAPTGDGDGTPLLQFTGDEVDRAFNLFDALNELFAPTEPAPTVPTAPIAPPPEPDQRQSFVDAIRNFFASLFG